MSILSRVTKRWANQTIQTEKVREAGAAGGGDTHAELAVSVSSRASQGHLQVPGEKLPQTHPLLSPRSDDDHRLVAVYKQTHFIRLQAQGQAYPTCPREGVSSWEEQGVQPRSGPGRHPVVQTQAVVPGGGDQLEEGRGGPGGEGEQGGAGVRGLSPNQVHP